MRVGDNDKLEFRDLGGALLIRAKPQSSLAGAALSLLVPATVIIIAFSHWLGRPALIAAVALAVGFSLLQFIGKKAHELRVTKFDFQSSIEEGFGLKRSVCCADVQWLEFQADSGSETSHPAGLYAVLKYRNVCLLPDLDEEQTATVIERIVQKFPELSQQWEAHSAFGQHFTTLNLDRA